MLKVEPLEGDWARQLEPRQGNHSAVFLALNRNKTSIALDYQSAAGQEVVQRLARSADMVLYDASPKHARALGLDYATLAAQNPQLIYGLLTPFGEHGPWANRVASELVVQAASGYPRYLGVAGQEPVRLGLDAASAVGGTFLLQGLLAALFYRQHSGLGSAWPCHNWERCTPSRRFRSRPSITLIPGKATTAGVPIIRQIPAGRRRIVLSCSPSESSRGWPRQTEPVASVLPRPRTRPSARRSTFRADGKNSTGLGADVAPLRSEYEAAFRHHTAAELVELVRRLEGAAYPYHTYETLFADEQAQVLQLLQQIPGPEGADSRQKSLEFFNASPCDPMRTASTGQCHGCRPRSAGVYGGAAPATLRRRGSGGESRDHPGSDAGATALST